MNEMLNQWSMAQGSEEFYAPPGQAHEIGVLESLFADRIRQGVGGRASSFFFTSGAAFESGASSRYFR